MSRYDNLGGVSVVNLRTGRTLCNFGRVAISPEHRRIGLLKSPKLQMGEGLLLAPCEHIHTVGMPFNIDVVFLDQFNNVLKIGLDISPGRQFLCPGAVSALELPPGAIESTETCVGDGLQVDFY
jgi:uncharacterized protein